MRNKFTVPALAGLAAACATPATQQAQTYANPVIDQNFPDPAIVRAEDGSFYLFATQGGEPNRNIQVARSTNLVNWTLLPDALPVKPAWASKTQDFWAPDVQRFGSTYYLYYSAKPDAALTDDKRGLCLAVATASSPAGPFTDSGRPLQCGESFVNIDPFAYDDPATGRKLLYWGSGFGAIKVQELADDRISFKPGSAPTDLVPVIKTEDKAEYQRLVEGVWVIRREGYYYLFYSGDNCCGPNAHYAVMVARSRSATGPFELRGRPDYLVVEANDRWLGPGHNAIVRDDAGTDWILYHGVDRLRSRDKPADDVNSRRVLLLDRLEWVDGWPRVRNLAPTSGSQDGPVVR